MQSAFSFVRHASVLAIAGLFSVAMLTACGRGPAPPESAASSGSTTTASTTSSAPSAQSFGFVSGATRQGTVQFPAGAVEKLDTLTAVNGFGTAPVDTFGGFTLDTLSSDAQYAAINTPAQVPLLCGWLGDAEPVINAHTTAEVYVYFAAFIYAVPDAASRTAIIASIASLPGLNTVEDAISAALVANPSASPSSSVAVQSAIKNILNSLVTSDAPAAGGIKAMRSLLGHARAVDHTLLFNPGTSASGITIVDNGQNSIQFQNTLRRGAAAYVDEVSHVDASGTTVTDQAPDTNPPVTIPAITAIGSFTGAITNYVNGNYALVPILTDLQEIPNLTGAKSTTYRIAVVGPGGHPGNINSMTELEQEMSTELWVKSIVYEVALPLIASALVPAGKFGEIQFETKAVDAALLATINEIAASNSVKEAAETGDPTAVYNAVTASLGANAPTLLEAVIGALELAGTKIASTAAATAAAKEALEAVVTPLEIVDGGIAVADFLLVETDIDSADKGDLFTVLATDPAVSLTPASSNIAVNASVTLTAGVHPPQSTSVVYEFTNTALFGHLAPTTGGVGTDNFTTSNPTVVYTANGTGGGTDTVTVTPQYLVTGLPNESLGTASATVGVNAPSSALPARLITYTASVFAPASANGLVAARTIYSIYVIPYFTFQQQTGATSYQYNPYGTQPAYVQAYETFTPAQVAAAPPFPDVLDFPLVVLNSANEYPSLPSTYGVLVSFGGGIVGFPNFSTVVNSPPSPGGETYTEAGFALVVIDPEVTGSTPTQAQLNNAVTSLQQTVQQQVAQIPANALPTLKVTD